MWQSQWNSGRLLFIILIYENLWYSWHCTKQKKPETVSPLWSLQSVTYTMQFKTSLSLEQWRTASFSRLGICQLLYSLQRWSLHIWHAKPALPFPLGQYHPQGCSKRCQIQRALERGAKPPWGTGCAGSFLEQQTARLAKWTRFCLLVSGLSGFAAAGAVAESGSKVGKPIITATREQIQCNTFFQISCSCSRGGLSQPPTLWTTKLRFC